MLRQAYSGKCSGISTAVPRFHALYRNRILISNTTAACYQYVNGLTEPVHALHVAMYQQVRPGARLFLTYEPAPQ